MYPVRVLSLNDGWTHLTKQKPNEWLEIQEALSQITKEMLTIPSKHIRSYLYAGGNEVRAYDIMGIWDTVIGRFSWDEVRTRPKSAMARGFQLRNAKNLVAALMLTVDKLPTHDLLKYIFIDGPRAWHAGICDVLVLLVPTDDCLEYIIDKSNRVAYSSFTESICKAQLNEVLPIQNSSPIVIVFFSNENEGITVRELEALNDSADFIERVIEFSPEYYQAGVSVLAYFGEVLRQKYPNINAKVRIEQYGSVVKMYIELPSGDIDIVEKTLEKYALVISEQAPATILFEKQEHIMRLELELEMTKLKVKQAQDFLQLTRDSNNQQIVSLQEEISVLRKQIGMQLMQTNKAISLVAQQIRSNEQVQIAQITHSNNLFKDLLGESHGNQVILMALRSLEYNLMSGLSTIDVQEQIKESLATIQQNKPALLTRIASQIEGAGYGAAAGAVLEWVKLHAQ